MRLFEGEDVEVAADDPATYQVHRSVLRSQLGHLQLPLQIIPITELVRNT